MPKKYILTEVEDDRGPESSSSGCFSVIFICLVFGYLIFGDKTENRTVEKHNKTEQAQPKIQQPAERNEIQRAEVAPDQGQTLTPAQIVTLVETKDSSQEYSPSSNMVTQDSTK